MKTVFYFLVRNLAFSCSLVAFATVILSFIGLSELSIRNTAFSAISGGILQLPIKYYLGVAAILSLIVWIIVEIGLRILSPKHRG